jgi:hypothetical protein
MSPLRKPVSHRFLRRFISDQMSIFEKESEVIAILGEKKKFKVLPGTRSKRVK